MNGPTLIVIVSLLLSCGTANQKHENAPTPPEPEPTSAPRHDLLVADQGSLPPCTNDQEDWLIYVKASSQFEVCSGGAWSVVNIQGPKGDPGSAGTKGDAGPAGASGRDAPSISSTEWLDPITNALWLEGAATNGSKPDTTICTNGWKIPDPATITSAINAGLALALKITTPCIWSTSTPNPLYEVDGGHSLCFPPTTATNLCTKPAP